MFESLFLFSEGTFRVCSFARCNSFSMNDHLIINYTHGRPRPPGLFESVSGSAPAAAYVHPEACQQPPQLLLLLQSQRRQPPLPLPPAHRFQQPCSRRKV